VSRSSRRDWQLDLSRDEHEFVRDVRESVVAASRGKTPRRGLEENAASRVRQANTDESFITQAGPSTSELGADDESEDRQNIGTLLQSQERRDQELGGDGPAGSSLPDRGQQFGPRTWGRTSKEEIRDEGNLAELTTSGTHRQQSGTLACGVDSRSDGRSTSRPGLICLGREPFRQQTTYLAPTSQNEMIAIVGVEIQREVVRQASAVTQFTIMMDETTDVYKLLFPVLPNKTAKINKTQLTSVCVRCIGHRT